jgi:hypothetical protein
MDEQQTKLKGLRKAGIAIGTITALTLKDPTDFRTTVVICIIAAIGIVAQTALDWKKQG